MPSGRSPSSKAFPASLDLEPLLSNATHVAIVVPESPEGMRETPMARRRSKPEPGGPL